MTFAIPTYPTERSTVKTLRRIDREKEKQEKKTEVSPVLQVLLDREPLASGIIGSMFSALSNCKVSSVPGPRKAPRTPTGLGSSNHKGWDISPIDKTKLQKFEVYQKGSSRYFVVDGIEFLLLNEEGFGNYGRSALKDRKIYLGHLDLVKEVHMGSPVSFVRVGNTGHSTGTHLHFEVRYGNSSNG